MIELTMREAFERCRSGYTVWVSKPVPYHKERTYYEVGSPTLPKVCRVEAWFSDMAKLEAMGVSFPLNYWTEDNG